MAGSKGAVEEWKKKGGIDASICFRKGSHSDTEVRELSRSCGKEGRTKTRKVMKEYLRHQESLETPAGNYQKEGRAEIKLFSTEE